MRALLVGPDRKLRCFWAGSAPEYLRYHDEEWGYPGRGTRGVVEAAVRAGATVRAWCDLDLDGVRIARMIAGWSPRCEFFKMTSADVALAPRRLPLTDRARVAIERDLRNAANRELADTLRAMLDSSGWVEQEVFLESC